jgi:uncharacterized CHY-type Zn-finger protein
MKSQDYIKKCSICGETSSESVTAIEYQGIQHTFCCCYCRARFIEECESEFIQGSAREKCLEG